MTPKPSCSATNSLPRKLQKIARLTYGYRKTLWVGDRFEDIPEDILAGDVVIKANHGSGFHQIVRNGCYDRHALVERTRDWMSIDYSANFDEWNYRDIDRKLFVEELLVDRRGNPVSAEAKILVLDGRALCSYHFHDRLDDETASVSLYGADGIAREFKSNLGYPNRYENAPPSHFAMYDIASRLSAERDHVRVDLYAMDGEVYFSEFTFYNMGGRYNMFVLNAFPELFDLWDLRNSWFMTVPQTGWRGWYASWLRRKLDLAEKHNAAC